MLDGACTVITTVMIMETIVKYHQTAHVSELEATRSLF